MYFEIEKIVSELFENHFSYLQFVVYFQTIICKYNLQKNDAGEIMSTRLHCIDYKNSCHTSAKSVTMHFLKGIVVTLPFLALCTGITNLQLFCVQDLMNRGHIHVGRQGFGAGEQDWGYITVRPGAHMFWWLYYTTADVENYIERPLIIWLQGGPGASSTGYGNFAELGPLNMELETRNYTWVKNANVLFIDNPVGSGFSYVDSDAALCKNNTQIANDLVEFLKQFYETLPEFKKVPLYVFGQSYGGKMAVEFVLNLYKVN